MLKRIRDWFTRPSWEEYLAEHAEAVKQQGRAEYYCDRNREMGAAIEDRIQRNGELMLEIQSVEDVLAEMKERFASEVRDREQSRLELGSANAEIERLKRYLMGEVEKAEVRNIHIEKGSIEVAIQPPHWAALAIAESFYETLADAPNWRSLEVTLDDRSERPLIVTVRRASGDSPEETVSKCKACIEELLTLEFWPSWTKETWNKNPILDRARALLNPEKKD